MLLLASPKILVDTNIKMFQSQQDSKTLFSWVGEIFLGVALLFVFDNYCLTVN